MAISRRIAAALGAGLALSFPVTAPAQSSSSGSGVSSGSGAGTGTGGSGLGSTGTGTSGGMSPSGTLRTPGGGTGEGPRTVPNMGLPNRGREGGNTGAGNTGSGGTGTGGGAGGTGAGGGAGGTGPGVDVPTPSPGTGQPLPGAALGPIESLRDPGAGRPIEGLQLNKEQLIELDARLLQEARAIARPDERSLALARVARSKILDGDFPAAETALVEAGRAALAVPPGLIRDLRLMTVVRRNAEDRGGFVGLAEALSTQGRAEDNIRDPDAPLSPEFLETWTRALRAAQMAWDQAADLAVQIGRRPYRAEALYQVVESQAIDLTQRGALLDASEAQGEELREEAAPARLREAAALIDAGLRRSAEHARRIDLVQWRDRALAAVVSGAAGSRRFELGLEIARSIPQPEARADALLRLAEAEARHGSPAGTTRAYTEALRSIASIPVADLRAILTGVMVDSLISSGRYDDARAATVLYPDSPRRRAALGAVAEAMGRRGLTDSANAWIARENPPELRAELHRRLNDGILTSLEQFRTRELSINPVP